MGLFTNLILSLIHLLLIAIDITFFFLVIACLHCRWQLSCLTSFNSVGKPLVDWFTSQVQKAAHHFTKKTLSKRVVLAIGMLAIVFVRFLLVALFSK